MDDLKILFNGMLAANVRTGLIAVIVFTAAVIILTAVLTAKYLKKKKGEQADAE